MRIGVLTAHTDWHFNDLLRCACETNHDLIPLNFQSLATQFNNSSNSIFSRQLPPNDHPQDLHELDGLIVRAMPKGSLQQIVFRMDLLGQLVRDGILVLNSPRTVEASIDKYLALELIRNLGVSVPRTAVCEDTEQALEFFEKFNRDVVVKPLFGSLGNGIKRLQSVADAKVCFEEKATMEEVVYMQEFIESGNEDLRLLVIGQSVTAMKRKNPLDWVTNASRGGICESYSPSIEEKAVAIKATQAVGGQLIGVDLARDKKGKLFVLEVNSAPGWKALAQTTGLDIGRAVLDHVVDSIHQHRKCVTG